MEQTEKQTEPRLYPASSAEDECLQNPAFFFFGKRLFSDQSLPEFLNELLLIFFSPKRLAEDTTISFETCFPTRKYLTEEGHCFEYAPSTRLNLKLFSFFSASRLDARHKIHRDHFECLQENLHKHIYADSEQDKVAIIHDLEKLFLGLRSAGEGRTWCAQQFLPLCKNLLATETIWNEKEAIRNPPEDWTESLQTSSKYWSINRHRFMARGGEVLYYQLCCALSQSKEKINKWNKEAGLGLALEEADPECLHKDLEKALHGLLDKHTGLDALAALISDLETETAAKTDYDRAGKIRYQSMGWCAADSWREGYLFAVELLRILRADVDIVDRLALLETACGLQILRTLSARTAKLSYSQPWPGYLLPITAPDENNFTLRSVSQHACKFMRTMQERLVLDPSLNCILASQKEKAKTQPELDTAQKRFLSNEVSKKYVSGLFFFLAKNDLGLIVPRTGSGERFVMSERILRLLVLTLVPAKGHLTLDRFKSLMRAWHGFVFDADGFAETQRWMSGRAAIFPTRSDAWLRNMLEDGNFLIHLSDACSLVHNPITKRQED